MKALNDAANQEPNDEVSKKIRGEAEDLKKPSVNFDGVISLIDDYAKKKGVKAEAYLFNSKILKMESEDGKISNYVNAETNGLNVRLFDKKKVSFSYCLGLEEQKIINALDGAYSLLKFMA